MTLLRLLFRHARLSTSLAIASGVLSGAATALFVHWVSERLAGVERPHALGLCLASLLIGVGANASSQLLLNGSSHGALYALRLELGRQLLAVPLAELERMGKNRVLATLTEDVAHIATGLTNIPTLCIYGSTLLVCFGLIGWLSLPALGVWCLVLGAGSAVYHVFHRRALAAFELGRRHEDELLAHFTALSDGARELRSNRRRRHDFLQGSLARAAAGHRDQLRRGMNAFTLARALGDGSYLVFLMAFAWLLADRLDLSRDTRSLVLLVILYSMAPLIVVVNLAPILGRARVAANAVTELGLSLSRPPSTPRGSGPALDGALGVRHFGRLELRGVRFRYPATTDREPFAIGPIDLELHAGETVFLCGGNGGGKTTLAKVLTGLYAPEGGQITVDGERVGEPEADQYRQLFSAVWFDFHLFDELPSTRFDRDEIAALLARLGLEGRVRLEAGPLSTFRLSTLQLSQGQRKRLALLCAWLEDRPIVVFDEWAADQDPEFRRYFYAELLPLLKARGKAVFAITHDDRYFHVADRLIRLDGGVIANEPGGADDARDALAASARVERSASALPADAMLDGGRG